MTINGSALNAVQTFFTYPFEAIGFNDTERTPEEMKEVLTNASCCERATAKFLFAIQFLTNFVALPVIAIFGFLAACVRGGLLGEGTKGFKEMANALDCQFRIGFLVSVCGLLCSLNTAKDYHERQLAILEDEVYDLSEPEAEAPIVPSAEVEEQEEATPANEPAKGPSGPVRLEEVNGILISVAS